MFFLACIDELSNTATQVTRRSTVALLVAAWLPLVLAARARPRSSIELTNLWQPAVVTPARVPGSTDGFTAISFARDGTGTAVGTEGSTWTSNDAGLSWRRESLLPATPVAVAFGESGVGLLASGTNLMRRSGAGADWEVVRPQSRGIRRLCFIDERTIIAVGRIGTASAAVLRSSDSGRTWTAAVESGPIFFDCAASTTGWVVAVGMRGSILRSADSGRTWEALRSGTTAALRSVAFAGRVVVVVGVGGRILRSSDEGDTWTQIPSGTRQHLHRVAFADQTHGVAVGAWGTMVRTDDAGLTWRAEPSGAEVHLADVAFAPDDTPVAVGSLGTIIRGRALAAQDSSSATEVPR